MGRSRKHAVVVGASMGGLCAAAALAPHYERVTLLDRDTLPAEPGHRRGVPQSKHAHGLQPGGMRAIDDLFPGIAEELAAGGACSGDISADCSWTIGGIRYASGVTGIEGIGVSRPFLEHRVRSRVAGLPNVTIRDGVEVNRLIAGDPGVVTGVELAPTGGGSREQLASDLVLDATGKVTKLPVWLAELGYTVPDEEKVRCRMAYLTRRWRLDPAAGHRKVVTVVAPAVKPHFAAMIAQEDGTHILTVGGLLDSAPDKTDEAYLAFVRELPDPVIADALVGASAVTDLQPSHFPASVRRRYDKMRQFPAGLLAIGDAIAAFNPMYGQGMSVAALEAVELRTMLARGPLDARKFFAAAHRIEDVAWKISTGGDLRFDEVEGRRTPDMKVMNRYLDRLGRAAHSDPVLAAAFLRVAGFVERPESLFKPNIVSRVVRGGRLRDVALPEPRRAVDETAGV
jgi:2-polyprenyl-6-methoxyphenol hydroxylase-like FAD-dependent oxidoreductase